MDKVHFTAEDINSLLVLNGLEMLITVNAEGLKKVCDRVNGWDAMQAIHKAIVDIGESIIKTIPDYQLKKVIFQQKQTEAHVGLRKPTGTPEDYWVMGTSEIVTLVNEVIHYTCLACDGSKHKCQIRRILKELPIEGVDTAAVACWR